MLIVWGLFGLYWLIAAIGSKPGARSIRARPPGLLILMFVFPTYQMVVIRVKALHAPPGLIDDILEWVTMVFTTYSAATVGLIAVFEWDALAFDRRAPSSATDRSGGWPA